MVDELNPVRIFFATDDSYMPFLAVTLESLIEHVSEENYYVIKILYTNVSEKNKNKILKYGRKNVNIEFVDLNYYVEEINDKLYTRDYYTKTTYFRLFIPNLYPQYDKALYLDSDIVILSDIAELYNQEMGSNLVAAIPDDVVQSVPIFKDYVEKVVGVASNKDYFNAGVLLMNLDELRKFKFQEKFIYSLEKIKFAVAQDQDYLNRLCKGRVKLLDGVWNRMPVVDKNIKDEDIKLIHYNLGYKPWHFDDILYKDYFWKYAEKTEFFEEIKNIKSNYTEEDKFKERENTNKLIELAKKEADCVGDDRRNRDKIITMQGKVIEKDKERLEILKEIDRLEREGKFDVDPEKDPPTIALTPDNVDYLRTKMRSKFKAKLANKLGERFFEELVKDNKIIIKEVNGMENLSNISGGAILTCNHFNPFDSFTVEKVFRMSGADKNRKLYKVIREGNYTNFSGFYGFLFRNCYTLPLSSNKKTMMEFMKAVDNLLKKGNFILVYPEQSLWWNYRKPKPLKNGAYKLAVKNGVPVVPIFITMQDSETIGEDGFPVQEYIVNIEKPIYSNKELSEKENEEYIKEENFEIWKNIYEDFYKIPLEYTTLEKKSNVTQ